MAVLRHAKQLTPNRPLETSGRLTFGQSVAFLGFPFGWDQGAENLNNGYPMPFVKAGIVSAILGPPLSSIYLDAHGNPGFSGGPLIFAEPKKPATIAGVICSAPGDPQTNEHAGFVRAILIERVLAIVDEAEGA